LLGHHDVVGLHERVATGEDGQNVIVKLVSGKNDNHAEEVGKHKSEELAYADMLPKQFPE
jgi:hypothetical protein